MNPTSDYNSSITRTITNINSCQIVDFKPDKITHTNHDYGEQEQLIKPDKITHTNHDYGEQEQPSCWNGEIN